MSEIPKLEIYIKSEFGEPTFTKDDKNKIIYLNNLKEVNAFWDKYKDMPMSFLEDYPEYSEEINDLLKYYEFLSDKYKLIFRNWLHDKLYRVE